MLDDPQQIASPTLGSSFHPEPEFDNAQQIASPTLSHVPLAWARGRAFEIDYSNEGGRVTPTATRQPRLALGHEHEEGRPSFELVQVHEKSRTGEETYWLQHEGIYTGASGPARPVARGGVLARRHSLPVELDVERGHGGTGVVVDHVRGGSARPSLPGESHPGSCWRGSSVGGDFSDVSDSDENIFGVPVLGKRIPMDSIGEAGAGQVVGDVVGGPCCATVDAFFANGADHDHRGSPCSFHQETLEDLSHQSALEVPVYSGALPPSRDGVDGAPGTRNAGRGGGGSGVETGPQGHGRMDSDEQEQGGGRPLLHADTTQEGDGVILSSAHSAGDSLSSASDVDFTSDEDAMSGMYDAGRDQPLPKHSFEERAPWSLTSPDVFDDSLTALTARKWKNADVFDGPTSLTARKWKNADEHPSRSRGSGSRKFVWFEDVGPLSPTDARTRGERQERERLPPNEGAAANKAPGTTPSTTINVETTAPTLPTLLQTAVVNDHQLLPDGGHSSQTIWLIVGPLIVLAAGALAFAGANYFARRGTVEEEEEDSFLEETCAEQGVGANYPGVGHVLSAAEDEHPDEGTSDGGEEVGNLSWNWQGCAMSYKMMMT